MRDRCPRCPRRLLTSMPTSHPPAAATALRDGRRHYCCPCLPPRRQSTLTLHPITATALRNRLHPCLPPHRRSTSRVARQRQCCILPPPPPCAIVFVHVFLPTAGQCCALMSTSHPPAATATCNLCPCRCPRPCPCPCRMSMSRVDDASSRRHRHARGGWGIILHEGGQRRGVR